MSDEELHERGIDLSLRLATMADRLQQTARELQELAEKMRREQREDS